MVNGTLRELLNKGYAKIGSISVEHLIHKFDNKKTFSHKLDTTSDLLIEAAKKGGDLVALTHDKQSKESLRIKKTIDRPIWVGTYEGMDGGRYEVQGPPSWSAESGKDKFIFSKGSVYRKEPALAKIQRHELVPKINHYRSLIAKKLYNLAEVRKLVDQGEFGAAYVLASKYSNQVKSNHLSNSHYEDWDED